MSVDLDHTVIHEHCEPALVIGGVELCPATRLTLYPAENGGVYVCQVSDGARPVVVKLDRAAIAALRAAVA